MKVSKFGGTSMANADSISKVAKIILDDDNNNFIVVSAPGKREKTDVKVTDLLYKCYDALKENGECDAELDIVKSRFDDIVKGLNLKLNLKPYFDTIRSELAKGGSLDYVASRGEYLSAIVTAAYLSYDFLDASELIAFDADGRFDEKKTDKMCKEKLKDREHVVIPGFYGSMPDGKVKTFSRGGSDVTGSIIARAINASVYENWTDVDGFMTCDPRIVDNPDLITMLTYKELRELSYMGANVLHPDSIFPVRKNDIPINIRNTFNPTALGTMIVPTKKLMSGEFKRDGKTITGIAGKKNFMAIYVEKSMMNNELGFARKVLEVLEKHGVSVEHMPSGIDTMTVVFEETNVDSFKCDSIIADIKAECAPDNIEVVMDLALIAVVGHGMSRKKGAATTVCGSLYNAGVNIRMIDQGSSELNIIVAVENNDYEKAISALYHGFKGN